MAFLSRKWFMVRPDVGGAVVNYEGKPEQIKLDVVAESLHKNICLWKSVCELHGNMGKQLTAAFP